MPTITVHTRHKGVFTYDCLETAVLKINHSYPIENLKYGWLYSSESYLFYGDDVVFYDEIGKIPVWKVKETFYNIPYELRDWQGAWRRDRSRLFNQYTFRRGPVPGTRKWRRGSYFKAFKTLNEARANEFLLYDEEMNEYGIRPRSSRRYGSLPNSWDDYDRSDYGIKNWKKYRSKQWKEWT